MRMTDLKVGWDIVGNDGQHLGTVSGIGAGYIVASRGFLSAHLYVPGSAIANVENAVVHLNLTKSDAEQMGWEEKPREPDSLDPEADSDQLHRHF